MDSCSFICKVAFTLCYLWCTLFSFPFLKIVANTLTPTASASLKCTVLWCSVHSHGRAAVSPQNSFHSLSLKKHRLPLLNWFQNSLIMIHCWLNPDLYVIIFSMTNSPVFCCYFIPSCFPFSRTSKPLGFFCCCCWVFFLLCKGKIMMKVGCCNQKTFSVSTFWKCCFWCFRHKFSISLTSYDGSVT